MRYWRLGCWVLLGSLGVTAAALAQRPHPALPPPGLAHPVQLTPGRRPLGAVLAELTHQSHLPLSYSSSLVPVGHRIQVQPGPPRPLADVLRAVLGAEHLSYGLLDGQLVIWPTRLSPPPGLASVNEHPVALPAAAEPATSLAAPANARTASIVAGRRPVSAANATVPPAGASRQPGGVASGRHSAAVQVGPRAAQPTPGRPPAPQLHLAPGLVGQAPPEKNQLPGTPAASRRPGERRGTGQADHSISERAQQVATAPAGRRQSTQPRPKADRGLGPLAARPVTPTLVALPALPITVAAQPAPARRLADAGPPASPRLRGLYLHAEAWASESLLAGATAKLGTPRIYLLLGAGLADNGRQAGPALGLGLGTAGRARGRFTPNLDALTWVVGTGRGQDNEPLLLAQLRPQLSWQVRRGGRLALVAGPTLNLATAHHRGPQSPRWDFGRDQWLWVETTDDESLLRLWPGVQVGVRF